MFSFCLSMEVFDSWGYLISICGVLKLKGNHTWQVPLPGARDVQGSARWWVWRRSWWCVVLGGYSEYRVKSQNILCSVHAQGNLGLKAMPTTCARCMRAAKYLTSYLVRPLHVTTMRSNSSNCLDVSRPRLAKRSHLPSTLQGQQIVVIMISWLIPSGSLRNIRITDSNMCSKAVKMFCWINGNTRLFLSCCLLCLDGIQGAVSGGWGHWCHAGEHLQSDRTWGTVGWAAGQIWVRWTWTDHYESLSTLWFGWIHRNQDRNYS